MSTFEQLLLGVQKPGRYSGGEWNSVTKDWDRTEVKFALSYPDVYEIGMSNLAIQILYRTINSIPWASAERIFAPWPDMQARLKESSLPLVSLESRKPLEQFDIIGFSLGHELTYTNVLNILKCAGIPYLASSRDGKWPLVIAGGSCTANPEPMAAFIDLFVIGEGEEVILELLDKFRTLKKAGVSREFMLRELSGITGVYVPSFYQVDYAPDGSISRTYPAAAGAPAKVKRRIVPELPPPPDRFVVPYLEAVQDRAAVEIQRGCSRGCRFCQAGILYRPVRYRNVSEVLNGFQDLITNCGYSEISPLSLSSSDYPWIEELLQRLTGQFARRNISISLPSLRLDSFSLKLMDSLPQKRKITLTFAPEAGTERLRRVINKNISDKDILDTIDMAVNKGWTNIKLYFLIGLPTETDGDIEGIISLVARACQLNKKNKSFRITLSTFVPKPHTPFQWAAQDSAGQIVQKQQRVKKGLGRCRVNVSFPDLGMSRLEAILSRGDRRLGEVIRTAFESGCVFDAWSESFNWDRWLAAFNRCGIDPDNYIYRERLLTEVLPWSHIDTGVSETFLKNEYRLAAEGKPTPDCSSNGCNLCGLQAQFQSCTSKIL